MKTVAISGDIVNFRSCAIDDQLMAHGVVQVPCEKYIQRLLSFKETPDKDEIETRAALLVELAVEHQKYGICHFLLDGPSFMIPTVVRRLKAKGLVPVFENRVDGEHCGFVIL